MPNLVLLRSRVVGVNTGEPQNWEALELRCLGIGVVAQRCTPILTCATASNLVVLRQRVYTVHVNRKEPQKLGSAGTLGWGVADPLEICPPHIC